MHIREELNPKEASANGVGEMIADAIRRGCREFIIGIGGSATTDGGIGMLMALGYEFLDEQQFLDEKMQHYAQVTGEWLGRDNSGQPGAGAAGGLGVAFLSFVPGAELKSGIEIVLNVIKLEEEIKDSDIVVTGEGRLDFQTAMGKVVPVGVAALAKKYGSRAGISSFGLRK